MTDAELESYRQQLLGLRAELQELDAVRRSGSETVELDQTRQGRLSRMDALQGQAMAQAGIARAQVHLHRIEAALQRIEDGSFGLCADCEEDIAPGRLKSDPATVLYINCAAAREQK